MNFAEMLIGKNMKAHPEALGLYIGLDEMYLAQTAQKEGGAVLESLLRIPIPEVDRSKLKPLELNDGFFAEKNWLEPLTKVAAKKRWNNTKVVVSLSASFALLRHFVIPAVIERKHWKEAIPLQARKYIHFPFEKTLYSYHVYELETAASKQKRLGVIFTMTPKSTIEKLEKGLRSVGLDPIAIEPAPLSLSRAFAENDKEAVDDSGRIYSFFGTDMASFVFTNQHAPVLFREVEIGGMSPVERRRFEITNCTEFISKQLERDPFEEAVIMGTDIDNWVALLEADSKKPVRRWNLSEVYGVETKSAGEVAAIGASTKFYYSKEPDLDFIKRNRLSDYEFSASLTFWKITVVVVLVLFGLLVKTWWGVHSDNTKLAALKKQNKVAIADFQGLTAQQIQSNLSRIKTQNSNLEGVLPQKYLTPILSDVVSSIPNAVWITKLTYKEEFPSKKGDGRSLVIEGGIQTGNSEQDLTVGKQFYDRLMQKSSIKDICGTQGEIKYRDLALAGNKPTGKQVEPAKKETSYIFTCDKKGASR